MHGSKSWVVKWSERFFDSLFYSSDEVYGASRYSTFVLLYISTNGWSVFQKVKKLLFGYLVEDGRESLEKA